MIEKNVGKYFIVYNQEGNGNTREVNGYIHPLYTITITNNEDDVTIEVPDVVSVFEREDWLDVIYTHSKAELDSDDPGCCYKGSRYIT